MTRILAIAVFALVALGFSSTADAQAARGASVQHVDPLDPFTQMAARVGVRPTPRPAPGPSFVPVTYSSDAAYADYLVRYERYLAEYARYQAQLQNRKPGWVSAMQGIGAGLQLADQAVSVYEHAVEAKALANYYAN